MKIENSAWPRGTKILSRALFAATLLVAVASNAADSPSDLLEQGLYSEQTKGDLDGAMQLYQKVIDLAKADLASAAQAQYHLGVCYYKKEKFTEANAAFAVLVKDYPDQTNIVSLARKYLKGAKTLPAAPWTDGEVMRLDVKLAGGMRIGVADYTVRAGETNGQKIWRFSSHLDAGGNQSISSVEAEVGTLNPLHSHWKHTLLGEADAIYYPDHFEISKPGQDEIKKLSFEGAVIDNEEVLQWVRALPLADGYTVSQLAAVSLTSRVMPLTFTASGPTQIEVTAGAFSCYKVDLNIGQTMWVSTDPKHYIVKFEGGGAVAELNSVTVETPGANAIYTDAAFGFSLAAPDGWSFDKMELDKMDRSAVSIIDPQGVANSTLCVMLKSSIKDGETNSVRKALEAGLAEQSKQFKEFKVRPDSWQDLTLAGHPAVGVASDYVSGHDAQVAYHVWSFDPANSIRFDIYLPASDFEAFRPKMDAVIASFQLK